MDALNIVAHERPHFVKLYTTCVTGSINSKRSTCEQAGRKIVRNLLIEKQHKKDNGVPPYHIDSLVKLRRSYKGSAADLEALYGSLAISWIVCPERELGVDNKNMLMKCQRQR